LIRHCFLHYADAIFIFSLRFHCRLITIFRFRCQFIRHFDCAAIIDTLFIFISFSRRQPPHARFSPGAASPPLMPLPIADMALCAVFAASMMPPLPARAADYYAATFSRFLADALSFSLPVFAAFSFSHFTPPSAPPCDFHV
jgi:hypothetical protein